MKSMKRFNFNELAYVCQAKSKFTAGMLVLQAAIAASVAIIIEL